MYLKVYCCRFRSAGTMCRIDWWIITEVSKNRLDLTFSTKQCKKSWLLSFERGGNMVLRNVGSCFPLDTEWVISQKTWIFRSSYILKHCKTQNSCIVNVIFAFHVARQRVWMGFAFFFFFLAWKFPDINIVELRRADHSSGRVLPAVYVYLCVT